MNLTKVIPDEQRGLGYVETVVRNPLIPHKPHPKQRLFLMLSDVREVMYGGAGGGGKSDALLMAAAQYLHVPGYAALIVRRNLTDLRLPNALLERSMAWWTGKGKYDAANRRWRFACPGGGESTLTFGYLDRDLSVYQYQSAEFQYIGFDELTQFTEFRYTYLFSRLRKLATGPTAGIPLRMRSATNPGGLGHDWVYKRFVKARPAGTEGPAFLPSKIADNPSINREEYEASLSHLDPVTREQIMNGDWAAMEDGRFKRSWLRYYGRHGAEYLLGDRVLTRDEISDRFLTVDPAATVASTTSKDPDYTSVSAWGYGRGKLLWLGRRRERVEVPDIAKIVHEEYVRHRAQKAYYESGGTQKGAAQLARRHKDPMNVIEINPGNEDKLSRAAYVLNMAEAERLWIAEAGGEFPTEEVVDQITRFPNVPHDDAWDNMAMAGTVVSRMPNYNRSAQAPRVVRR